MCKRMRGCVKGSGWGIGCVNECGNENKDVGICVKRMWGCVKG